MKRGTPSIKSSRESYYKNYLNKNIGNDVRNDNIVIDSEKLYVISCVCQDTYIRIQEKSFRNHIKIPYEFIIFNDAKRWSDYTNFGDSSMYDKIKNTCDELSIKYIDIDNSHHRILQSASHRHCDSLRAIMRVVKNHKARFWIIDSDMWCVGDITEGDFDKYFEGDGSFVHQERDNMVYAWPNLWFIDTRRVDVSELNWDIYPQCDSGGMTQFWLKNRRVNWIPYFRSTVWGIEDMKNVSESIRFLENFLLNDPRNVNNKFWAELYNSHIFHIRAGSNWNREGIRIHRIVHDLAKNIFQI